MWKYVIKRLLWLIPIVIGVAILIFTIMYFVPGDPATVILSLNATDEEILAKRAELGLDQPYIVQLGRYLSNVFLHFDFGKSYLNNTSIAGEIMTRFPRTLLLCAITMVVAIVVGIPLGVIAGTHQGKFWDSFCMVLSMLGVSMPAFWVALMLVMVFSYQLNWFPAIGYDSIKNFILPAIAGSFNGLAIIARQTRSSMLDAVHSDYITTAKAKGVSQHDVIWKHALPNSLLPVLTVSGTTFGKMLGGTVVIESIFSIPGIGTYMINGINNRDYPVVEACVIFLAILFSLVMLLVDVGYAYVDPRIKARYIGK